MPDPWGIARHAEVLVRVLDATGVDRAVVVGRSMGAFVAVTLGLVTQLPVIDKLPSRHRL
jgi:pimeloyl-ACP methyl ester carboxylesterase